MSLDKVASVGTTRAARRSTSSLEIMIGTALRPGAVAGNLLYMARRIEQIHEDIRALTTPEKEDLLRSLWEELDGPGESDVDAAWLEEARRRDQEIDGGHAQAIPADEVFKRLEASLKK